ncbi:hypothetical protein I4U23_004301 [Adineta vaga]|nr:hypothetical protein I4U23_004301 [Adineta vaga]
MEEQKQHRKHCTSAHCLNLFRLLFAALPTIVFGVFTIVFTLQQDASAKATRAQDQRQADEMNRRLIFKEYIDDMRELFLHENFEKNINKSLLHIRVQTLTVLKHLDPVRKHDVIIFLYENRLIRRDQPYTVQLHGADLSGMKFIKSSTEQCDLPHLYLPGINANNIIFRNCFLVEAVFDNAFMNDAIFDSCNLASASFSSANLTNAYLHNNQFFNATFSGTYLVQTSIKAGVFQKVNLTNVDLYRSDISHSLLYPMTIDGIEPNIILNTRFPNATISDIDTRNLILDGQAQTQCHLSVPTLGSMHIMLVM